MAAVLAGAWGACPDPGTALEQAEKDVLAFELDDAEAQLDAVVDALGCNGPVDADVHRRFWLARGVWHSYGEAFDAAAIAFAASKRRTAEWNTDFGLAQPDPEGAPTSEYTRWTQAEPSSTLHPLELKALPGGGVVWVDGLVVEQPYQLAEGAHLLQVGVEDKAFFARALVVDGPTEVQLENVPEVAAVVAVAATGGEADGDTATESNVRTDDDGAGGGSEASSAVVTPKGGLLPTAKTSEAPVPQPAPASTTSALPAASGPTVVSTGSARAGVLAVRRQRHTSRGLLISGLVLGTIGGAGLGAAGALKSNYDRPDTGLFIANQAAGWSGWGFVGVGGTLVGTSFLVNKW